MIIQAELKRKQSEYEGEACTVAKVIELPALRFQQFSRALLSDYDFIAENKNAIRHDTDSRHCLFILDTNGTDGFLVDPQLRPVQRICSECSQSADAGCGDRPQLPFAGRALAR